ncbi:hypothetical protein FVE85_7312 [Porphyridium purpureum]|uniref:Uncharacterized protein n=1 Tax=Porphyridium purpureum TaxID=35688 RepID=A0A5J4ZAS1_PORPP|nr:hypothetical protein FVE85_7312 [Porphyridium purpureum]|eukprot:POR5540..scf295_1
MAGTNYGQAVAQALAWLGAAENCTPHGAERHEALALVVHALLLNHGFRSAGTPVYEHEEQMKSLEGIRLPSDWGKAGYGGKYCHSRSSLTFEIRLVPLGSRLVCHGAFLEDEREMHTLELNVDRYVLGGRQFEERVQAPEVTWKDAASWTQLFQNVEELAAVVQISLAQKLVPDSSKDGYADYAAARTTAAGASSGNSRTSAANRTALDYRQGEPPIFEPSYPQRHDPLRVGPPMRARGPPFGVGDDDLYAPGLPQFPSMSGGLPGGPGGGNLVGPRHPGFGDPGRYSGGMGIGMPGRGMRPPPPGARYDPVGPPGMGLGEPDNDMMMPPGMYGPPSGPSGPPPGGPPPDMYW